MTVTKYLGTMASNYSRYFHPLNFITESSHLSFRRRSTR